MNLKESFKVVVKGTYTTDTLECDIRITDSDDEEKFSINDLQICS
jgi:hypothetical protein